MARREITPFMAIFFALLWIVLCLYILVTFSYKMGFVNWLCILASGIIVFTTLYKSLKRQNKK